MLDKRNQADRKNRAKGCFRGTGKPAGSGNMGTIIRSCAAAGVKGLVTCGDCVDLFSPKTVRSSMGGIFHIQYKHFPGSDKAIAFFKENKILTYALALTEDNTIYDIHRWEGVALFIGNESNGLQKSTVEKCDRSVFIPMPGYSESLNAAVAASLHIRDGSIPFGKGALEYIQILNEMDE